MHPVLVMKSLEAKWLENYMTNFEKIKNMNIDELAEKLDKLSACRYCSIEEFCNKNKETPRANCKSIWEKWLKSEAEDRIIKIWVDDKREMPEGYDIHVTSVEDAIKELAAAYAVSVPVEISLDHDAGTQGGNCDDYIKILILLEKYSHGRITWNRFIKEKITFHLHTTNPAGRDNMRRIIQKNGWREV